MTGPELADIVDFLRNADTDSTHVEAKRARHDIPSRLWETVSAFSNTRGGGAILLGIEEASGFEASGVEDPGKVQSDLGSLLGRMDPPIRALIEVHDFEGAILVTAEIPELPSDQKPCFYPGAGMTNGAFVRVGDGDRRLTPYEVQLLLAARGQPRDDERPEPRASREDLDDELLDGFLARLRGRRASIFRDLDDDDVLRTTKVLVDHGGLSVPSVSGLIALGRYPQEYLPSVGLTLVVYPTVRVGEPGPGGERFLDNADLDGPIPRIVDDALGALRRNMRQRSIVVGAGRRDLWEYPETALREAIANALAHRDLSALAQGTPVQMQMFPDRLAIINPGGLFGPVTIDRLGEQGVSAARNQTLMKLLEDVPRPGTDEAVAENRGSGIGAMLAALRNAGMGLPAFRDTIATFSVTFPNHTLLDAETVAWLAEVDAPLTSSQQMALAAMRRGEELDNPAYRNLGDVDSRVATRELGDLVALGLTEARGSGRWTTYRLDEGSTSGRRTRRADRREDVLAALRGGARSRQELESELDLPQAVVLYWLRTLRQEGKIQATGASARDPRQRYALASP